MKILALADLHVGESRESTTHPGIVRQANSAVLDSLERLVNKLKDENFDLIVQMGDVVRDLNHDTDLFNYETAVKIIRNFKSKGLHLLGNHDNRNLSIDEIEKITSNKLFGVLDVGEYQVVWIDFTKLSDEIAFFDNKIAMQIESEANPTKKKILFTHYSLVDKATDGNFYFEKHQHKTYYSNLIDVTNFLNKLNIKTVVSAHDHWGSMVIKNNINYITLPSYSENFLVSSDSKICPAVYSIIDINSDNIIIDSYSGDYSFFHLEFKI